LTITLADQEAKFPAGDPNAQTYIEFDGTTNLFYHRYDDGIEERRNGDPEYVKYWEKPADVRFDFSFFF
jgi:hypothetical protein